VGLLGSRAFFYTPKLRRFGSLHPDHRYNHDVDREIPIIVPHADHGDPECCGCLFPVTRGEEADIVCNECGVVIRTVPASEAQKTILELSPAEICSETCPRCGAQNVFPGFSAMEAFTCRHCGTGVVVQRRVQ
jgi:hypothetical protein